MNNSIWRDGRMGKRGDAPRIMFAQVREDAAIELEVLRSLPAGETVFSVASGGCTAFALLLAKPAKLHVVDINRAQIFLVELKRAAIAHLSYSQLLPCLLEDACPFYPMLRPRLGEAARVFWDENPSLLARGLNNCGAIETHLRQVMRFLPLAQRRLSVRRLFAAKSLQAQRRIYEKSWNHWRWKLAFQLALSKPVLKSVYGIEAVKGVPPTFARDMKRRVGEAFTRYPIGDNGYLWQAFRGVYPPQQTALPLYLQRENQDAVRQGLEKMHLECADAADYLEAQSASSIGFFALSNISEMAPPEFSYRLLRAVAHAAKPGAKICMRSIFPFDDALFKDVMFEDNVRFERIPSQNLEDKDRSIFCKNLMVLRVLKS